MTIDPFQPRACWRCRHAAPFVDIDEDGSARVSCAATGCEMDPSDLCDEFAEDDFASPPMEEAS